MTRSERIRAAERLLGIESVHAARQREAAERKAEVDAQPLYIWPMFRRDEPPVLPANGPAVPWSGSEDLVRARGRAGMTTKEITPPAPPGVSLEGPRRITL